VHSRPTQSRGLTQKAEVMTTTTKRELTPTLRTAARQALTFVGIVYTLVLIIAFALPHANRAAPMLSMVTPVLVVGLITVFGTPRGQRGALWRSLGVRRLGLRSWPLAVAIPLLLVLVVPFGAAVLLGSAEIIPVNPSPLAWLGTGADLVMQLAVVTLLAMTEEIGWRGYLLPRVQTLVSKRWAALVVGFIHGLFHLPLILLTTTYDSVGSRYVVAPLVVATLTAAGVLYAWLKDRSGSVWPVAVAHSTVNTFIEGAGAVVILSPIALAYTAGESGVVTFVAVAVCAAIMLVRASTWGPVVTPTQPETTADPAPAAELTR
jgi:membrane protease YdiL (CAAX protease family)